MQIYLVSIFAALGLAAPTGALADDIQSTGFAEPSIVFHGGVGIVAIRANEYVYEDDAKVSQLIWESTAPVVSGGLVARSDDGWTLALDGSVAAAGHSRMSDYDWVAPFATGQGMDDWSHYGRPAETRLDHYFSGTLALGHDFVLGDGVVANFNAGLKYTDVKWSGSGGSYIYSVDGFRDTVGTFPDDLRIIDYRQRYSAAFAGLDLSVVRDRGTFGFSAKGGLTFSADDIDHHWRHQMRYNDKIKSAPTLSLGGRVEYAAANTLSLFVAATFDQVFKARADTIEYDMAAGQTTAVYPDGAGADFRSATLTIGLTKGF